MQTVSFAGSNYNIPSVRGDTPWSGLSDFVIAAASKAINTGGGSFTLLADLNFGATFGLVSTYFKSRASNAASAGALRLASTDVINWRNNANGANISLSKDTSDVLKWNSTKLLLSGAVVNADIDAAAAIAYSKLNLSGSIVNADVGAAAAIAVSKLAALTASRAVATDGSGFLVSATTTATELGYVNGVTSAIQTQMDLKAPKASPTFTGTVTTPVTASRALVTGASSELAAATTTATEIGYVNGVTSAIQTQMNTKATDTAVVHNTGTENVAGAKTFTTQLIGKGTTTNDDAAAGYIGEYIAATATATNFPSSGTYGDFASISLTAGDWDVSLIGSINRNAATVTEYRMGISITSGNSSTGLQTGDSQAAFSGTTALATVNELPFVVPSLRKSYSGTTTTYFKFLATFSAGTPQVSFGRISGRRVR